MKTGAEPKKVAILAALLVTGAVILYFNVFSGDSETKRPAVPAIAVPAPTPAVLPTGLPLPSGATRVIPAAADHRRSAKNNMVSEFKIRQGVEPGAEKPDPATIDPTLRLDLLAKLQNVEPPASMRNIFQYGAAPPPPAPVGKPVELPKNPPTIAINRPPPPLRAPRHPLPRPPRRP